MRATSLVVLGLTCIATGCTSLISKKLEETPENVATGLMYRLPKKQFDVVVAYELVSCSVNPGTGTVQLSAKVSGTLTESVVGDDAQTYFLDYSDLSAPTKVSKIDIGVSDTGLLTSINSTITDQTGPIITNMGTAAFSIARGIALGTVAPGLGAMTTLDFQNFDAVPFSRVVGPRVKNATDLCATFNKAKQEYDQANTEAKTAANRLKKRSDDLDALARRKALDAQLKEEQSFYKQYGTTAQQKAAAEALDASSKALAVVQREVDASNSADTELEKKNKALTEAKAKLFIEHAFSFAPSVSQHKTTRTLLYSRIDSLFAPTVIPCTDSAQKNCVVLPKVNLSVTPVTGYAAKDPAFKNGKAGIVYRLPATAQLEAKTDAGVVFLSQLTQVPQYGHIASLDLKNGVFADNLLKITFNSNGAPTQLSFASQSQAEAASKAASQTAQSYFEFAKSRQQDKIDTAKAQIGLDKDRASANAAVAADNLNFLRDIQKLQALANGTSSEAATQLDALNNQRDMLEVQLKILALQKQINDAKASLASTVGQ
jgi:hypothetical protein